MSENLTSAPHDEAGSDRKSSEQPAEAPSTAAAAAERPSLFERLTSFFRPRNGSRPPAPIDKGTRLRQRLPEQGPLALRVIERRRPAQLDRRLAIRSHESKVYAVERGSRHQADCRQHR